MLRIAQLEANFLNLFKPCQEGSPPNTCRPYISQDGLAEKSNYQHFELDTARNWKPVGFGKYRNDVTLPTGILHKSFLKGSPTYGVLQYSSLDGFLWLDSFYPRRDAIDKANNEALSHYHHLIVQEQEGMEQYPQTKNMYFQDNMVLPVENKWKLKSKYHHQHLHSVRVSFVSFNFIHAIASSI